MARDVFISYRSEDKEWADKLCAGLEGQNISCWMAPRDIAAGREWAEAIVEALQQCKSFVLVLSSHSSNTKQISREAELADHQGLPIYTFRLENVEPPPGLLYFLGNLQWLDGFGDQFDSALARLADVICNTGAEAKPRLPPFKPAPPLPKTGSRKSITIIAIAVAAAVSIAMFIWLRTRVEESTPGGGHLAGAEPVVPRVTARPIRKQAGSLSLGTPAAEAQAKAEEFLDALRSSNYDEAWNEYGAVARRGHPKSRMVQTWTEGEQRFGPIQAYHVNRCTQDSSNDVFTCLARLDYKDGVHAEGRYVISRSNDGIWGLEDASHSAPRP